MLRFVTINTVAEFICMLTGFWCLYRDKEPAWRLFIFFLPATVLVEVCGIYLRVVSKPNFMLYNVFLAVECVVQNYFFCYLYLTYRNTRKLLAGWLIVFAIFYFTELIINRFGAYVSRASTFMSVELILASVYFYYLLIREERSRRLATYAPFWWVNGTVCFYFAGITSNLFFSYLVQDRQYAISSSARYIVFSILNIILYLSWSYAFICRYRQRTSTYLSS